MNRTRFALFEALGLKGWEIMKTLGTMY